MEGRCHACGEWVALQGTKDVDVLVKELYWCVLVLLLSHFNNIILTVN
jgi:hypothetical protein